MTIQINEGKQHKQFQPKNEKKKKKNLKKKLIIIKPLDMHYSVTCLQDFK